MKQVFLTISAVLMLAQGCTTLIPIKAGPAEDITVESTPDRIARGQYLANYVTVCIDCHSTRDWQLFSGPPKPGTEGIGGEHFGPELGIPGYLNVPNITPSKLGDWTDGEFLRAFRSGVSRDGRPLFPLMPYLNFRTMTREDAYSVVAYIRTLPSIERDVAPGKLKFPMNYIVRTIPGDSDFGQAPDEDNEVARGKYLTTIAGCAECHTLKKNGKPVQGMDFAGGWVLPLPREGTITTANITPDMETGIGNLSRANFIGRFKAFDSEESRNIVVPEDDLSANTYMPWTMYAGMTEADLGAIYTYLRTVPAVHNQTKLSPN